MIRTAIIGLGWPGRNHARSLRVCGRGELVAVCDKDVQRASAVASETGARAYADYREMLDREKLDAVLLCTPHTVRAAPIRDITRHGLALFCEKPPAFTLDEARECAAMIERSGVINSVGFMYRWSRITERMRELLSGHTVAACMIRGCWGVLYWEGIPDWLTVKERSGGPIVEQGVHLIDVARYMLQDDIVRVHAFEANTIVQQSSTVTVPDTVSVNLQFGKGTLGSHLHQWSHRRWIWEVDCVGEDFRLTWDMVNNRITGNVDGDAVSFVEQDDCYLTEIAGFCEAVELHDQSRIRSSYADSTRTLAVAIAANQSFDLGKPVPVVI